MTKQRQKLIAGIISAGVVANSMGIISYANETKNELTTDEIMNIPGLVYIVTDFGEDKKPSIITEGFFGSDYYGYALLNKDNVVDFIKWLVEKDSKYAQVFDLENLESIVGTEEFNNSWSKASELSEYDFALNQQIYIMETKIKPIMEDLELEIDMDIAGHRGIEELLFSKYMTYGENKGVNFVKEALLKYSNEKNINFNEVVDKVVEFESEFIKTRKSMTDKVREAMLEGVNDEAQYLKEINDFSLKYEAEKEDTSNIDSETTSFDKEIEDIKTSLEENDKDKFKNSLVSFISKIFNF